MNTTNTTQPDNSVTGSSYRTHSACTIPETVRPPKLAIVSQTCSIPVTIAEIAAKDFRKAEVFQRFGIDFCCGGGLTLQEASQQAGISEGELRSALQLIEGDPLRPEQDFARWDLAVLVDHIVHIHHRYIRDNAPILLEFARKVAGHHGKDHPELIALEEKVRGSLHDLMTHIEREEKVLFPAIRHLAALARSATPASGPTATPITDPTHTTELRFIRHAIGEMQAEHAAAGEDLRLFRRLTNGYTLPEGACNSYAFLFEKMKAFEEDLHRHIHLENNILFPRALALLGNPPAQ